MNGSRRCKRVSRSRTWRTAESRKPAARSSSSRGTASRDAGREPELSADDKKYFDLAEQIAAQKLARAKGVIGVRDVGARVSEIGFDVLHKALRAYAEAHCLAYKVDQEDAEYLDAAKALRKRGFSIVVFGHTHLAKRVGLGGGGTYLNTGTWADLMRMPAAMPISQR